jgi:hypothetical protein
MKSKDLRIILDTNILISYLISKNFMKLDKHLLDGNIRLLFSQESMEEFLTVIQRPRLTNYFSPENIEHLLSLFSSCGESVDITSDIKLCRDAKDNFLLNLAVDGSADYLITGDQDLLEIKKIEETQIITVSDFLKILK